MSHWTAEELGLPPRATFRCLLPLPDGLAVGSDRGLVLWRGGRFLPFPWPRGARAGARVEALAFHRGVLHVATTRGRFEWPLSGPVTGGGMPMDPAGVYDEIRAMAGMDDLLIGWRTRLEGATGPGDCSAFTRALGRRWAGTLAGGLLDLDGPTRRTFSGPVRHLLGSDELLLVGAAGALHRFDGRSWSERAGEPYALAWHQGVLAELRQGRLWMDGEPRPHELGRPWCLASHDGDLWVGALGALHRLRQP